MLYKEDFGEGKNIEFKIEKLEDLGLLCRMGKELQPTHAFMLMTRNKIRYAKI